VGHLADGTRIVARASICATGVEYRKLGIPNEDRFHGAGVYYGAGASEASLCVGHPVVVVGGGNSAAQSALFLSRIATRVHLLILHDDLERDMSRYLADRIERAPNVEVVLCTEVRELVGEKGVLESVIVENHRTGERRPIEARALFVFIGAEPHVGWLAGQVALDDGGYVLTGPDAIRGDGRYWEGGDTPGSPDRFPLFLETNRPGVFAVGDVRSGSIKRVASAVGEGSMAVRMIHERLNG
jgi:thioredoxin reductase (NADPH)